MCHLLYRQNQAARSISVRQDRRPWPGNTLSWSEASRTNKGLPPPFTYHRSWARHQAEINTAHTAWGSAEGKDPGYLVDNSHYTKVKGLEDSLGNLDHNYTQTRLAHPTSAHH